MLSCQDSIPKCQKMVALSAGQPSKHTYVKFPDKEHKNNHKFQMRAIVNAKFCCKNIQNPQDNPIHLEVFLVMTHDRNNLVWKMIILYVQPAGKIGRCRQRRSLMAQLWKSGKKFWQDQSQGFGGKVSQLTSRIFPREATAPWKDLSCFEK